MRLGQFARILLSDKDDVAMRELLDSARDDLSRILSSQKFNSSFWADDVEFQSLTDAYAKVNEALVRHIAGQK